MNAKRSTADHRRVGCHAFAEGVGMPNVVRHAYGLKRPKACHPVVGLLDDVDSESAIGTGLEAPEAEMAVGSIRFNTRDAELLFSFPKTATDLGTILRCFTFINRTSPPSFDEFASCLTKGLRAGIVRKVGERFVIDDEWYGRIHGNDAAAENEIEAMLEFESGFVNVDCDETTDAALSLTEEMYESVLTKPP